MKKLIFGLLAAVLLGMSGNAQANQNNPFDYVGKQDNDVVNDYLSKYESEKLTISN